MQKKKKTDVKKNIFSKMSLICLISFLQFLLLCSSQSATEQPFATFDPALVPIVSGFLPSDYDLPDNLYDVSTIN